VLVISAPNDKIAAHADAKTLARATGGELLGVPDGGHCPQARKPVGINLALRAFAERAFTADSRELRAGSTRT
jgi:pimeloyl-ACP methyl ester carboxylesterase